MMQKYWLMALTVVQLVVVVMLVIMCQKMMWLKDSVKALQSRPVPISSPAEVAPAAEPTDMTDNAALEPEIIIEVDTSSDPGGPLLLSVEEEPAVLEIAPDESLEEPEAEEQFFDDLPAEDRVETPTISPEEQAMFDAMEAEDQAQAEAEAAAEAQALLDAEAEAAAAQALYNGEATDSTATDDSEGTAE